MAETMKEYRRASARLGSEPLRQALTGRQSRARLSSVTTLSHWPFKPLVPRSSNLEWSRGIATLSCVAGLG